MPEETNDPELLSPSRSRLGELRLAVGFLTRLPVAAPRGGGRALLPWALAREPRARADGLAVSAGRPGRGTALAALLIGLVILILAAGPLRGVIAALVSLIGLALLPLARRQLGGLTG